MKKGFCLLIAAMIAAAASFFPSARASSDEIPPIILYTVYRQAGWGDRVQAGCVDTQGGLWTLTGYDGELRVPYGTDEQIAYFRENGRMSRTGNLTSAELFDLKSLISAVEHGSGASVPSACDAGTEKSYAVRYGRDGSAECVLLGMSGDDCFENTDPNAQALYLWLRRLFPGVTCYGAPMGPAGFSPVPLSAFCGLDGADLSHVSAAAVYNDCEEGPVDLILSDAEQKSAVDLMMNGIVIGKVSAAAVTGGSVHYVFSDAEGNVIAAIDLYRGLLLTEDGMYSLSDGRMGN